MTVSVQEMRKRHLKPEDEALVSARAAELLIHNLQEMDMASLRKLMGLTQVGLAQKLNVSQANISGTENRSDVMISQISKFIEAGGGRLELVATLPNHAPVKLALHKGASS